MYDAVFARYYDELGWNGFALALAPRLASFLESQGCRPGSMLDVACGTGVLMAELRGLIPRLEVFGVDQSEEMLKVAGGRLGTGYPSPFLRHGDMAGFALGRKFDLITCTYDSLNHILEPEGIRSAFATVARHLNPGAWYVVDVNAELAFRANWNSYSVRHTNGNLVMEKSIYDARQRLAAVAIEATILRENLPVGYFTELFWERAYAADDLVRWMQEAGLDVRFIKDFRGNDLAEPEKANRLFFYATRA
jgi:SAM-dependent methyltransferase